MLIHSYYGFALSGMIRAAMATMVFENPPNNGPTGDFSSNPTYTMGNTVEIQWADSPEDAGVSLLLYQLNATTGDYFLPGQYIFQNSYNVSTYDWVVAFSAEAMPYSFATSNLFYFSLYQEGHSSSDTNSHYFYIKEAVTASTTSTTSATSTLSTAGSSLAPTTASSATTTSTAATSTAPTATASQPSNSGDALGTSAKIGIGVGIAAAVIVGVAVGWFVRRRKTHVQNNNVAAPQESNGYYNGYTDNKDPAARFSGQASSVPPHNGPVTGEQHNWPAVFEASGESRASHPAELYGNAP